MSGLGAEVWCNITRRPLTYALAVLALGVGVAGFLCIGALGDAWLDNVLQMQASPLKNRPVIELAVSVQPTSRAALDGVTVAAIVSRTTGREAAFSEQYAIDVKAGRRALLGLPTAAVSGNWFGRGFLGDTAARKGRLLRPEDDRDSASVCVVSARFAEAVFPGGDPVGQTIRLAGRPFRVVGVSALDQPLPQFSTLPLTIPASTARDWFRPCRSDQMQVLAQSTESRIASDIKRASAAMSKAIGRGAQVSAFSPWLMWQEARTMSSRVRIQYGLVGGLNLVIGLASLVSMLLANLHNRIREIGIHRALGATSYRQVSVVFLEATSVGLLGGCFGAVFGVAILRLVAPVVGIWLSVGPLWVMACPIISTIAAACASAIPAWAALKLSPAEALGAT